MEDKNYIIQLTEREANAIMDAVESVDGWVSNNALCDAAMKIVDAMNGLEVRKALDEAESMADRITFTESEAEERMRKLYDK